MSVMGTADGTHIPTAYCGRNIQPNIS